MYKSILVTGGAGFMGSYFIKYMTNKYPYITIVNYDLLTYAGNLQNLIELANNERYHFVHGDVCDQDLLNQTVRQYEIEVIVHFAAETHVDKSLMNPINTVKTNVLGVASVLEVVRQNGIKMVQISTDEVFGSISEGYFREDSPMLPNSPYSAGKAGGDLLCHAYVETYKTPVIVTHCCNVMGPYQYPEKIIPLFITNLLEGKRVPVYGDGLNVREWIYVEDHSRAIEFLLEHGSWGEVYNIGTGEEHTNLDLTHALLNLMEKESDVIEYVEDRKGHDRRYAIDASKIRALGWNPHFGFNESLAMIARWYQDNIQWWSPIKSGEYRTYYEKQYKNK